MPGSTDPTKRRPPAIESLPVGLAQVTTGYSMVYAASDPDPTHVPKGSVTFTATSFPEDFRLGLWNRLWNAYIDTDDPAYDWFGGPALSDDQRLKLLVIPNDNWAQSSDLINQRVFKMKVVNNDTVAHGIYFKYKTYTFTGVS